VTEVGAKELKKVMRGDDEPDGRGYAGGMHQPLG
jgi:hypothetical protein